MQFTSLYLASHNMHKNIVGDNSFTLPAFMNNVAHKHSTDLCSVFLFVLFAR